MSEAQAKYQSFGKETKQLFKELGIEPTSQNSEIFFKYMQKKGFELVQMVIEKIKDEFLE